MHQAWAKDGASRLNSWSPEAHSAGGKTQQTCVKITTHTHPPKWFVSWVVHGQSHWSFSKEDHANFHGRNNIWLQPSRRGSLPNIGNKIGWERLSNEPNRHNNLGVEPGLQPQLSASADDTPAEQGAPTESQNRVSICGEARHGIKRGAGHQ